MAADHGVRVFTVGFGSASGGAVDIDGMSIYMRFDEETLKGIAGITQAEYFHAERAPTDLKKIYEGLNTTLRARAQGDRDHRAVRGGGGAARGRVRHAVAALVQSPVVVEASRTSTISAGTGTARRADPAQPYKDIWEMNAQITALIRHSVTANRHTNMLAMKSAGRCEGRPAEQGAL